MEASVIIQRAQRLANRVDSDFNDRCYQFLNEAMEQWALQHPWSTLKSLVDIVCDGTALVTLPPYILALRYLMDITNKRAIDQRHSWDREGPAAFIEAGSGSPIWWEEDGIQPVMRQPATANYVRAVTTASEALTVHLAGLCMATEYSGTAAAYYVAQETLNLNSATDSTSANKYYSVQTFAKLTRSTNDVKLFDSSSNLLGRIPAERYDQPYRRIRLLYVPSAGTTLRAGVIMRPPEVYKANQVPHSSINPNYLVWYVAALMHKCQGQDQKGMVCMQRATELLQQRAQMEETFGDRDWSAMPDSRYWYHDSEMQWRP